MSLRKSYRGLYKRQIKVIVVLSVIIILGWLIHYINSLFGLENIEDYIASFGPWVPLILLIVIIIASSIGFIFTIPVALAALLLNIYEAFFISIVGLSIGASLSFLISRYLASTYVQKKFINTIEVLKRYDEKIGRHGFFTVLFLRLISLIPYEAVNIAAGLSQIRFLPFILATILGIIPGTAITIYFIKNLGNVFSMQFVFALILLTGFALLPLLSKRIRSLIFSLE